MIHIGIFIKWLIREEKPIKNKLLSAVFTTLFMGVLWMLSGFIGSSEPFGIDDFMFIVVIMAYTAFGTLIFGIPVSLLSDWVSNKLSSYRFIIAVFIHLSLAVATYFVIEDLSVVAVGAAVFFFTAEEWQNRKLRKFQTKSFISNTLFVIVLFAGVWGFYQLDLEQKTDMQYLIPKGYEGVIVVKYNQEEEPPLVKEKGKKVIQVSKEELEYTSVEDRIEYGVAKTSSDEPKGMINDEFYYVTSDGERTRIDDSCIYRSQSGSIHFDGKEGQSYEVHHVTNTNCGDQFSITGNPLYSDQEYEVIEHLFSDFYKY